MILLGVAPFFKNRYAPVALKTKKTNPSTRAIISFHFPLKVAVTARHMIVWRGQCILPKCSAKKRGESGLNANIPNRPFQGCNSNQIAIDSRVVIGIRTGQKCAGIQNIGGSGNLVFVLLLGNTPVFFCLGK